MGKEPPGRGTKTKTSNLKLVMKTKINCFSPRQKARNPATSQLLTLVPQRTLPLPELFSAETDKDSITGIGFTVLALDALTILDCV